MVKNIFNKIVFAAFIFSLFLTPKTALGIGMVTEPLIIKDVLRGQEISSTVTVFNSEKNSEVTYQILTNGEIKDWATFYEQSDLTKPITEIKVPAASYADFTVKFKIPSDIDNKTYNGEITILLKPATENTENNVQMTVVQELQRSVSIIVTDTKILDFASEVMPLSYEVALNEPMKLRVTYTNNGNTIIKPDLKVKITNATTNEVVNDVAYLYPQDLDPVKVHERKTLPTIEWRTNGLNGGKYLVETEVMLDNKSYFKKSFYLFIGFNLNNYTSSLLSKIGITDINKPSILLFSTIAIFLTTLIFIVAKLKLSKPKA